LIDDYLVSTKHALRQINPKKYSGKWTMSMILTQIPAQSTSTSEFHIKINSM